MPGPNERIQTWIAVINNVTVVEGSDSVTDCRLH
uniref:Uncharacterized protein n=1 Tax=Anguilla anguilla TaxID=7936 RepID=A0A0E9UZC4_ANGAN